MRRLMRPRETMPPRGGAGRRTARGRYERGANGGAPERPASARAPDWCGCGLRRMRLCYGCDGCGRRTPGERTAATTATTATTATAVRRPGELILMVATAAVPPSRTGVNCARDRMTMT